MISIMLVNNEVGTVEPVEALSRHSQKTRHPVPTLTECRLWATYPIDVKKMGVDMMFPFCPQDLRAERGGRSLCEKGSENFQLSLRRRSGSGKTGRYRELAGIVGFGKAAQLAEENFERHVSHCP